MHLKTTVIYTKEVTNKEQSRDRNCSLFVTSLPDQERTEW